MRPRERRETGEQDLFRSRLDQIIDMNHPLAKLARTVDWGFLEGRFGEVYTDDPGHPPLPTRLMAGLAILKHTFEQAMLAAGLIVGIGCCVGHVVDHVPSHLSCAEFLVFARWAALRLLGWLFYRVFRPNMQDRLHHGPDRLSHTMI